MKHSMTMALSPDGRTVVAAAVAGEAKGLESHRRIVLDLATRQEDAITSHCRTPTMSAASPLGSLDSGLAVGPRADW